MKIDGRKKPSKIHINVGYPKGGYIVRIRRIMENRQLEEVIRDTKIHHILEIIGKWFMNYSI